MKHYLIQALLLFSGVIFFMGCNDESAAGPGATDTFIKLYGSENAETAADLIIEDSGNLLLLSTQEIEDDNQFISEKIVMRYLDDLGNLLWQNSYPEGEFDDTGLRYLASSVITHPSGYLITGQSINVSNQRSLLILNIDPSGNEIASTELSLNNGNTGIAGVDVVINSNNEIKATALVDSLGNEFWVGTFDDGLNNQEECSFFYPAASTNPRMLKSSFITSNDDVVFGISGLQNGIRQNGRLAKVPTCQPIPLSSPFIATQASTASFTANYITQTLSGFALVGTTNTNGNDDIFLARVNDDGVLLDEEPIIFSSENTGLDLSREEEGLTITQAADGGLLIGGSSESNDDGGSDIFLVKTDFNGTIQWTQFYGDRNDEEANIIGQAPNNGFVVLGTTEFGGINTLILIKTDNKGNVN